MISAAGSDEGAATSANGGDGSDVERAFRSLRPGNRMEMFRRSVYDDAHTMFYAPASTRGVALASGARRLEVAADSSIRAACLAMVRVESTTTSQQPAPNRPRHLKEFSLTRSVVDEYQQWAEAELVGSRPLSDLLSDRAIPKADKLHAILGNPSIGNSANRTNVNTQALKSVLDRLEETRAPLQIVVPAFPFKDQGAFNTDCPANTPDFGEVALLVRLHCLALVLTQVHYEYVQWIVMSDGPLYAPIFGLRKNTTLQYLDVLKSFRDQLNLRATVHIVGLEEVVEKCGFRYGKADDFLSPFVRYSEDIRHRLEEMARQDAEVRAAVHQMTCSLIWNIDTRRHMGPGSLGSLWGAVSGRVRTALFKDLYSEAREAAFRYLACNIGLKLSRAIELQFPDALRGTSHAKPGQVAIPRLGPVSPWNGVGHAKNGRDWRSLRSVRLHSVWRSGSISVYYLDGNSVPFLYRTD